MPKRTSSSGSSGRTRPSARRKGLTPVKDQPGALRIPLSGSAPDFRASHERTLAYEKAKAHSVARTKFINLVISRTSDARWCSACGTPRSHPRSSVMHVKWPSRGLEQFALSAAWGALPLRIRLALLHLDRAESEALIEEIAERSDADILLSPAYGKHG